MDVDAPEARVGSNRIAEISRAVPELITAKAFFPRIWRTARQRLGMPGRYWKNLSLVSQFAIAASIVMVAGMIVLGSWVSSRIIATVVQNAAISTAFYMDSYIAPLIQNLTAGEDISDETRKALQRLGQELLHKHQVAVIKIWSVSGTVVFSTDEDVVGKSFPATIGFNHALSGKVHSEFDQLDEDENTDERKLKVPLVEIYSPIRRPGSDTIMAVAEFYLFADKLDYDIAEVRRETIGIVATVTLVLFLSLLGIVNRGSRMIGEQRAALQLRVDQLSDLLRQNEALHGDLFDARRRIVETNERVLRRIGADLHDGPAQLVGLALLRFHQLDPTAKGHTAAQKKEGFELIRKVLEDTLGDLRTISHGIAPPNIENLSLSRAIELAARIHEKRTGTEVECSIKPLPEPISGLMKTSLYRFVQEGLSNAFRHGGGQGQVVRATVTHRSLRVEVEDRGKGFAIGEDPNGGLGLAGLRDRIECLGGHFSVESVIGRGTRLAATFDLDVIG